jgi:2,4-dienoyl-CoA reductase-like NADH-dependent reductase (Old Yellow Enzyme family)
MDYARLFDPITVGGKLTLKNRLVMAPMTTASGETDGRFSTAEITYLERRAQHDIGLVMTPACYCHKSGHSFDHQVGCHTDEMLRRLAMCAEAINRHGAASFLQIHHGGNMAREHFTGRPPMAPSAVLNRLGTSEMPRAMTEDEIRIIIAAFAAAAGRAKKAGFTGIELHGANTYLFQQFFSRFTNKRTDQWGCTPEMDAEQCLVNRARFASEVIKAVRAEVGSAYPISYRISPEEADPDGYNAFDVIELLQRIVPLGIDIVHVSSFRYGTSLRNEYPAGMNPTSLIRQAMPDQVAVIGVGGVRHPDLAVAMLDDGIDLIALGKILLLDAEWAGKVRNGRIDTIRMGVDKREQLRQLDIPDPMKIYSERHFFPPA